MIINKRYDLAEIERKLLGQPQKRQMKIFTVETVGESEVCRRRLNYCENVRLSVNDGEKQSEHLNYFRRVFADCGL